VKALTKSLTVGLILIGGVAVAKVGVSDPQVKMRMETMGSIAANLKTLGDMAGGKVAFDEGKAAQAAATVSANALSIPVVFEPQATDPVSEAKPEIWTSWDDFTSKAEALQSAAAAIDTSSVEGIQAGMGAVGGACKACHSNYRM
jgi:cytochrome c556